jgi:hypothetical protein
VPIIEIPINDDLYAKLIRGCRSVMAKTGYIFNDWQRPDLFCWLSQTASGLLLENHGVPVIIGASDRNACSFAVADDPGFVPQEGRWISICVTILMCRPEHHPTIS